VAHRDIKPDNIGIAAGKDKRLQLVLFDFSLARTPPENLHAGTRPYLDPFLSLRRPPRWDLYAERFAVAVTLYELLTRRLPYWGDAVSDQASLECEATIESEHFDPALRDGLTAFFAKALRREARERYDNAAEMLRAWRRVFDEARRPATEEDEFDGIARRATPLTTIAELGYGLEAQNVLDQMGIHTVRELLAVDRVRFRYLKGVGDKVRKEIRLRAKRLAQLRPDLVPGGLTVIDTELAAEGATSIDDLAAHLLPKRPLGDDRPEERALAIWLGLETGPDVTEAGPALWPSLSDAARACDLARGRLTDALVQTRERWQKAAPITASPRADPRTPGHPRRGHDRRGGRPGPAGRPRLGGAGRARAPDLAGAVARAAVRGGGRPRRAAPAGLRRPPPAPARPRPQTADWALALGARPTAWPPPSPSSPPSGSSRPCKGPGARGPGPAGAGPAPQARRRHLQSGGTLQPRRDLPPRDGARPGHRPGRRVPLRPAGAHRRPDRRARPGALPGRRPPAPAPGPGSAAGRGRPGPGLASRPPRGPGLRAARGRSSAPRPAPAPPTSGSTPTSPPASPSPRRSPPPASSRSSSMPRPRLAAFWP
jgi:hypothetical protein